MESSYAMLLVPAGASFVAYNYLQDESTPKMEQAMLKSKLKANAVIFVGAGAAAGYGVFRLSGSWTNGLIAAALVSGSAVVFKPMTDLILAPLKYAGYEDKVEKQIGEMEDQLGSL